MHEFRKSRRTPEETARLRADRERYQREKPSPEQLLKEGGHDGFLPLGVVMLTRGIVAQLRKAREEQGVTLAILEERTDMDQAMLSRVLGGKVENPTVGTLCRIAAALGKQIDCRLVDALNDEAAANA